MISFHLPFLVLPLVTCSAIQLNLLSTPSASSIAPGNTSSLSATRLTTYNECYDHSEGQSFRATKSDCERALDGLVSGKSLLELHSFGYYKARRVTDVLPIQAEYGSCAITLMTFDLEVQITMTFAEIYAELLGPDGVLKKCLGPGVPAADALGGQTVLGPQNKLAADVVGLPIKPASQKSRLA